MFFDVGGVFEHEGEPAQWIGYIESGYFKYVVHNRITGKAQTRYEQLLQRCPNIVQKLPLQEIASYLRVTPTTVSKIRKELLEKERG